MKPIPQQQIVIIGCGNVAWHLAKHFSSHKGSKITVVNHRTNPLLNSFKTKLKCTVAVGLDKVPQSADYYFICVSDRSIASVADKIRIRNPNALLVHTSGSASIRELGKGIYCKAVLYPLQSFSRSAEIDWRTVPVITESNDKMSDLKVKQLAEQLTDTVLKLDQEARLRLHLSAVLVNNFTNSLFVSASDLLKKGKHKTDLKLLLPLMQQTLQKLSQMDPRQAQTGPAKRKDKAVMKKHLQLIGKDTELKKLYKQFSKLIEQQQNQHA